MRMRFTFLFLFVSSFALSQTNPFALVNSPYDEQNPVISPDGKSLYLTIANHPQNVGGLKDPGDIWISIWTGGGWSAPVHGGSVLNNRSLNGVVGFSTNGDEMYLLNHYAKGEGVVKTQGISVSMRSGTGWTTPRNISIPYFLNRSSSFSGFLHYELQAFVFAAEAYNTLGSEDLYVTFNAEGRWAEPINLGNMVNTPFQEMSPSLSSDGLKLYFASNGRRSGLGSFDLYMSERLDDTWKNWSTPINLGPQINSEGRELFVRNYEDQGLLLYTSTRNSDGYGDIRFYQDSLQTPFTVDTVVKMIPLKRDSMVSDRTVRLKGRVSNSKSNVGVVNARITFRADSVLIAASNEAGDYEILIPSTQVYSIEVEAKGHVSLSEKLDIHTFEMQTLEMNFKLQPIEVGAVVSLKSVLFEIGTTDLLEESYDQLNVVVDFLQANPKVEIELEGHTDNRGDRVKNQLLSQQRVDKIKSYLVSKGISARRIRGKGYGGSRPIATNDTEEARRLNRRVEFRIVKD